MKNVLIIKSIIFIKFESITKFLNESEKLFDNIFLVKNESVYYLKYYTNSNKFLKL